MKKTPWLAGGGILLVILLVAGTWGYNYYLRPDPELQRQLEEDFGADFFYTFDLDLDSEGGEGGNGLPVGDPGAGDNSPGGDQGGQSPGQGEGEGEPPEGENGGDRDGGREGDQGEGEGGIPREGQVTEQQVLDKYMPRIKSLEKQSLDRLETLFDSALRDMQEQSQDGSINRLELARRYYQAASKLEKSVDKIFDELLEDMKAELEGHGLPTGVIKEARKEYNSAKAKKKSELLARVR